MSRIVDDDPPIKSHVANRAYRDNFDRIFGEPAPAEDTYDFHEPIPMRVETFCGICGEIGGCVCDDHDPACARLCTEGADCDCGARC
jgi:hypothetical protein